MSWGQPWPGSGGESLRSAWPALARQRWGEPPECPPPTSGGARWLSAVTMLRPLLSLPVPAPGGSWVSVTFSSSPGVWDHPVPNGPVSIVNLL